MLASSFSLPVKDVPSDQNLVRALAMEKVKKPITNYYHHRTFGKPVRTAKEYIKSGLKVRNNPVLSIHVPIDWAANPNNDQNWLFQKNATYVLSPLLLAYKETEDDLYLSHAKNVLLDWIEYHGTHQNPFQWYDMGTGIRAAHLAFIIEHELRRPEVDSTAVIQLIQSALEHIDQLADPEKLATGNHAYFQLVGLAALCKSLEYLTDCPSHLKYATEQLSRIIISQFTIEGIQREHSPDYHHFSLKRAQQIVDTGWFTLSEEAERRLFLAEENHQWLIHPNAYISMIGDSDRGNPTRIRRALVKQRNQNSWQFGKLFRESGYAILREKSNYRQEESYLIFWAGEERPGQEPSHPYAHSHADNFTFEWTEGNRPILTDSGKYSYEEDEWRDFFRSTRAHNSVEIDQTDHVNEISVNSWWNRKHVPEIVEFVTESSPLQSVKAKTKYKGAEVEHTRQLVLQPGRWLVIVDKLEGGQDHDFSQWFHFHEDWRIEEKDDQLWGVSQDTTLQILDLTHEAEGSIHRGEASPQIQGWISTSYLTKTERSVVGLHRRGSSVLYATLIHLDEEVRNTSLIVDDSGDIAGACWHTEHAAEGFRFQPRGVKHLTSECSQPEKRSHRQ